MSTPVQENKPRLFRIGPGLVLALIASFLVWIYLPKENSAPPLKSTPAAAPVVTDSPPEPAWLLENKEELKLSAAQFEKLSRLKARWDANTKDLRAALQNASADFERGMKGENGATMQELQQRGAPVAELTRRLVIARRAWWNEATGVLRAEQKQQAEKAWTRRWDKHRNGQVEYLKKESS